MKKSACADIICFILLSSHSYSTSAHNCRLFFFNLQITSSFNCSELDVQFQIYLQGIYNVEFDVIYLGIYYFNLDVQFNTYPISTKVKDDSFLTVLMVFRRYGGDIGRFIGYQLCSCSKLSLLFLPLKIGRPLKWSQSY